MKTTGSRCRKIREAPQNPRSSAAPSLRKPPGPATSAALAKASAVERELAQLAFDLGIGRDACLMRALSFYRKFVRRGRRYGHAPETFLAELLEAFEHRDIHQELAQIRR
ncbi:MAG TPA: hypothetical protein VHF22_12440, partial [Planctomycetota bacterium]|nr:hypothetical protein [Planctomycetota bacterium]